MRKYTLFILLVFLMIFLPSKSLAYTATSLNRNTCSAYELVYVTSNSITHVECYSNYNDALNAMNSSGTDNGVPSIIYKNKYVNSKYAIVNLRTKPSQNYNTILYETGTSSSELSYINGYYASDAALINVYYTGNESTTRARIAVSGLEQYVPKIEGGNTAYEIVPITQVKSPNKYRVSNGTLIHYIAKEIGNDNSYSASYSLGPAPSYLQENVDYYSYDGKYFYTSLYTLIDDYRNGNRDNTSNRWRPYYSYYQFLPQRTKTNITAAELDSYLRGEGKTISNSKLYGQGHYFITSQNIYGINALISYSISLNESAKGSSNIAMTKNNVFGHAAYDYDPSGSSSSYSSVMYSIYYHADKYMSQGYAYSGDWRYYGSYVGNKLSGVNVKYASDPYWGEKAASYYYILDKKYGLKDYNYYTIGMKTISNSINLRSEPNMSSKVVYTIPWNKYPTYVIVGEVTGEEYNGSNIWYKILFDSALDGTTPSKTNKYDFGKYIYAHSTTLEKINNPGTYRNPASVTTIDTGIEYKKSTTDEYYEISKDTNMYYDSTLTINTYQTLKKSTKVKIIETAYNSNGTIAYLVQYGDKQEWIKADDLKYDDEYNKLLASIKYKTLDKPILLKLKDNTTIYNDSILTSSLSLTQKKDTYVVATKLAYTSEKNYSYQIVYDVPSGSSGYIDASKVEQVSDKKIGNNGNNNTLIIRSEANTTSSRLGSMANQYINFVVLEEVTGQDIQGNNKWYKIIYNSPNNSIGYVSAYYVAISTPPAGSNSGNTEEPPKPVEPEKPITYTKKTGIFEFTSLTYDETSKKFNLIATLKVDGVSLSDKYNVKYDLILKDLNKKKPDKVIGLNEHNYSNININALIDLSTVEQGDYALYVRARVNTYEAECLLNNVFGRKTIKKITVGTRGYLFRTNYYSNYVPIELSIRDSGNITNVNNPTNDNMFNDYVDIKFDKDKLYIKGTSYNVNGNYSKTTNVERQIILENTATFERKTYDIGYIDNGDYEVVLRVPDNMSKTRAWFDSSLDLSTLEKGTYIIYIRTTSGSIDDYGELIDIFARDLSKKTITLSNGNKAKLKLNKDVRMRIELVIE